MVAYSEPSFAERWRGRWENQLRRVWQARVDTGAFVSWHLGGGRRFFTRHFPELARAHRWCFIVGCNNSGTSLLHTLLRRTGQVSSYELEGQRYTRTLTRAARRGHQRVWTEFLDELRLTEADSAAVGPRLLHDWLRVLPTPIAPLIVEKTTANAVRMRWLQEVFPNSYFIGMVRNGYAVTEGTVRKGERDVVRAARHWNTTNTLMLKDAEHLDRFYWLPYERLVEAQDEVASELSEFLGIDRHRIVKGFQSEFGFTTVNGRGPQGVENLNAAGIARLDESDLRCIDEHAGEMLRHFGYWRGA